MGSRQDGPRGPDEPSPEAWPVQGADPPAGVPAPPLGAGEGSAASLAEAARDAAVAGARAVDLRMRAGLMAWGGILVGGVLLATLARRHEIAPFLALAALFALMSSWDARARALTGEPAADVLLGPGDVGRALRLVVPPLVPLFAAALYGGFADYASGLPPSPGRAFALPWCVAATIACFALALPPVSRLAARLFVRPPSDSHVARLTAVLAAAVLLLPVPVRLLFDELSQVLPGGDQPLVEVGGLVAQLAGELAIALAAVGLWVARDARATLERLGLGRMGLRHWVIAAVGLAAVSGINGGLEWVERAWLPDLWQADQEMSRRLVGELALPTMLVLGLSAGVGEEVLVRGALQPRSGILWASVLFGAAHVQYTWFGMLVIVLLGIALGLVRRAANTTTAVVVHAAYDIIAAMGLGS